MRDDPFALPVETHYISKRYTGICSSEFLFEHLTDVMINLCEQRMKWRDCADTPNHSKRFSGNPKHGSALA